MKKVYLPLLLLLLLPLLAFGKDSDWGLREDDWYRVIQSFPYEPFHNGTHTAKPGQKIYVYGFTARFMFGHSPKIAVFDSNGRYLAYYWLYVQHGCDKGHVYMRNPEYCTFLENREDKRYK